MQQNILNMKNGSHTINGMPTIIKRLIFQSAMVAAKREVMFDLTT